MFSKQTNIVLNLNNWCWHSRVWPYCFVDFTPVMLQNKSLRGLVQKCVKAGRWFYSLQVVCLTGFCIASSIFFPRKTLISLTRSLIQSYTCSGTFTELWCSQRIVWNKPTFKVLVFKVLRLNFEIMTYVFINNNFKIVLKNQDNEMILLMPICLTWKMYLCLFFFI